MWTKLHWVKGPWPGTLALSARPRGGDWLADEMEHWRTSGVNAVLSLLTDQEVNDLGLETEQQEANRHNLEFLSFPIPDREVPNSEGQMEATLKKLERILSSGKNVVIHCRQGVGRTGLIAACLLATKGIPPDQAVAALTAARGIEIPETPAQEAWIGHFAASLAARVGV